MKVSIKLEKIINIDSPIFLTGPSGTGKSYLANQIHRQSKRKASPFITANLATISETLLESELFGNLKGAFTDASAARPGLCGEVLDGTLFLDEIGDLSLGGQKKLLQLLEERRYFPVGSSRPFSFSGRIIAATNRNIKEMVGAGLFREDLYFRLMIYHHELSPIKGNRSLISQLLSIFLKDFSAKHIDDITPSNFQFSDSCYNFLLEHSWPGNIRELKHCVEYLITCAEGPTILLSDLPAWASYPHSPPTLNAAKQISPGHSSSDVKTENAPTVKDLFLRGDLTFDYHRAMDFFEQQYLRYALEQHQGKINQTARILQISKSTLLTKIKKYKINNWQIKSEYKFAA